VVCFRDEGKDNGKNRGWQLSAPESWNFHLVFKHGIRKKLSMPATHKENI